MEKLNYQTLDGFDPSDIDPDAFFDDDQDQDDFDQDDIDQDDDLSPYQKALNDRLDMGRNDAGEWIGFM